MKQITGTTRLYGILADPIHHVQTPQHINALIGAGNLDAVMVPWHVSPPHLAAVVAGLRGMDNLDGFVVTVPHKTAMLRHCDAVTPEAAQIGAVNVVRRTAAGRLLGGMLDGAGFVAGLRAQGMEVAGRRAYVAGAGGAASAIVHALAQARASHVTVANRTREKAAQLVERLRSAAPQTTLSVGGPDPSGHDLVVNATSLGLREDDPLPLDAARLAPSQIVAEIIMQPEWTPLLRAARERGCRLQHGAPMLRCQLEFMLRFMRHDEL